MFTNVAAYRFAHLQELRPLRARLIEVCRASELKGSILLSPEGVNLFVAGREGGVEALLAELRAVPGLEELAPKFSQSEGQPFHRMLVRIKREIIAFGVEGIDPVTRPAPKLAPRELKRWLDEGRPVTLLDTRNDYEVKLGTFRGARTLGIGHFRQFPAAVRELAPGLPTGEPVVMFCTGGIRCEKAGPLMERDGFANIFQLEGGILKYFEECGGAHFEGDCFVFDQRVGVDPSLQETEASVCFRCQTPLTPEDRRDERFVEGESCPYCARTSAEKAALNLVRREAALRLAATPLPGSVAYENRRPLKVPPASDGCTLGEMLAGLFPQVAVGEWAGRSWVDATDRPVTLGQRVRAGERYVQLFPETIEPAVNAQVRVWYEDEAILVLEKPAPLPMHASGRFHRNTLQFLLERAWAPEKPRPAHRLDANTTGLVICARTRHFAGLLQPQFARGEVEKVYLVRVVGHPPEDEFGCALKIGVTPGELGSRAAEDTGQPARTEFRVMRRDDDGTALLEARPRTGRTNQIRVHLWELGWPVHGDPTYLAGRRIGDAQTLPVDAAPLCLHAWRMDFTHPVTRGRVAFASPAPAWANLSLPA